MRSKMICIHTKNVNIIEDLFFADLEATALKRNVFTFRDWREILVDLRTEAAVRSLIQLAFIS